MQVNILSLFIFVCSYIFYFFLKFLFCSYIILLTYWLLLWLLFWSLFYINYLCFIKICSRILSFSFVWNMLLCFCNFLDYLCWFLCLHKTATFPSLEIKLIFQLAWDLYCLKLLWLLSHLFLFLVPPSILGCTKTYIHKRRLSFSTLMKNDQMPDSQATSFKVCK